MSKKNPTLNEMLQNPEWVEKKPCPRCKEVIWWAKDGHDGKLRSPQVHACVF